MNAALEIISEKPDVPFGLRQWADVQTIQNTLWFVSFATAPL